MTQHVLNLDGQIIDIDRQLMEISRAECEEDLAMFVRQAWHVIEPGQPYIHGWHIDFLCEHLTAITDGVELDSGQLYNRLLINVPPGFSKSLLVGVFWPAWEWGPRNLPHHRFVCASHSLDLAIRDGLRMRRLITSDWYIERWGDRVQLTGDQNQKTKFENTSTGFRQAAATGSITGSRGDRVVCLPFESMVLSSQGWMPIGRIVEERLPVEIAGASQDGLISWQRIEEYEINPARPLVRIKTRSSVLECTTDHQVFVNGRGWVAASEINPGDTVKIAGDWSMRELLGRSSGGQKVLLPQVLPDIQGNDFSTNKHGSLRSMRDHDVSGSSSLSTCKFWPVLFQRMFSILSNGISKSSMVWRQGKADLFSLQKRIYSKEVGGQKGKMVFFNLRQLVCLGRKWASAGASSMRALWDTFSAQKLQIKNMLTCMRCRDAILSLFWQGERSLCAWTSGTSISARMDKNIQSENQKSGWELLPRVWEWGASFRSNASCASHQLREKRLEAGEPDNRLQNVSWGDARRERKPSDLATETVISVDLLDRSVDWTYNLRAGPHHNYFANGMLVHNCDDPHSVDGANSDAMRESTVQWFKEAVPTRLNNPDRSAIVVIMQRLHQGDVSGVILDEQLGYDHIMLPMEFDPTRAGPTLLGLEDPRTEDRELLFPERFSAEVVARDSKVMGPYATAGQFQQQPAPRGGGIIKPDWWETWVEEGWPPIDYVVASLDTAYTTKTENDYSALTIWGIFSGDINSARADNFVNARGKLRNNADEAARFDEGVRVSQLLDHNPESVPRVMLMAAWQERLEMPDLVRKVIETCKKFKVDTLLVEAKASGISVSQELRRLYNNEDFGVHLINPGAIDKLSRLYSVQHLFSEGIVYAPDRHWSDLVIRQCEIFPKGTHDDLVDTVSMALRFMRDRGLLTRAPERIAEIDAGRRHVGKAPTPLYPI